MSSVATSLQHHFADFKQQKETAVLGMWSFLIQEVMFFGGLFLTYVVYRSQYPGAFALASAQLNVNLGGANTIVLICSSLTMAMAVHAASKGNRAGMAGWLLLTIMFGSIFLGVKVFEYKEKWDHGLIPGIQDFGLKFDHEGVPRPTGFALYFALYFAMTGLHAVHMIIGIPLLLNLAINGLRGKYGPHYYTPVEMTGLYWHFVDIVWIFLFPLLYLIGAHVGAH
ncbi:MAG: cytochrome c oxidase subunit 3 family protein [Vicinamibacteria bacterium]